MADAATRGALLAGTFDKIIKFWTEHGSEASLFGLSASLYNSQVKSGKFVFLFSDIEDHITRRFMEYRGKILQDLTDNDSKISFSIGTTTFLQQVPWDAKDKTDERVFAVVEAQYVDKNWKLCKVLLDVVHVTGGFTKFSDITKLPGYEKYQSKEPFHLDELTKKFLLMKLPAGIVKPLEGVEEEDDETFMKNRLIGYLLNKILSIDEKLLGNVGVISVSDEFSYKQMEKYNPTSSRALNDLSFRIEEEFQKAIYDSTLFSPLQSCVMRIAGVPKDPDFDSLAKRAKDALHSDPYMYWKEAIGMVQTIIEFEDLPVKFFAQPVDFKMFKEAKKYFVVMEDFLNKKLKTVESNDCGAQVILFSKLRKDLEAIKSTSNFGSKLQHYLGKVQFDTAWILAMIVDPRYKMKLLEAGSVPGWTSEKAKAAFKLKWRETGGEDESEIDAYLSKECIPLWSDVLDWWKTNSKDFPIISRIAKDYLAIINSLDPDSYRNVIGSCWDGECNKWENDFEPSSNGVVTLGDFPPRVENVRMGTCVYHWFPEKSEPCEFDKLKK